MEYDEYELKNIKRYNYSIDIGKFNYFCYELFNGDIIFNFQQNKFCYFNMKSFSVQTIIGSKPMEIIDNINQLNDINYFYFLSGNISYKFNIRNGRIKRIKIDNKSKENSKVLGEYYINYYNNKINIITENNKNIYTKDLREKIKDIVIIDKKEKIFASLTFCENPYLMNISFFKLRKHNN